MQKLTVESLNDYIDSVKTDEHDEYAVKIPTSKTYPEQVYIHYGIINTLLWRELFLNLFCQSLVAFTTKKTDFPAELLCYLGEKDESGKYKKWTDNDDDIGRFLAIAMYTGLVTKGEHKTVTVKGRELTAVFLTISDEEIKPAIVKGK